MKLEIGMYVRTINGKIWIITSQKAISGHRKDIIKASHNIIDLTDFVNHLAEQNQKYKEVIDKLKKHCEIEINASNHYLKNHSSQQELCHKVAHQRILDILKEVE